jgi:hypothetical protein
MDTYTPDGTTIYGVFLSRKGAEDYRKYLESEDNEYGRNMNEDGTIEINTEILGD